MLLSRWYVALVLLLLFVGGPLGRNSAATPMTTCCLSLIDLSRPGLERVRSKGSDTTAALAALLEYYRGRTDVKHPVDPEERTSARGHYADPAALAMAENGLQHRFPGQPAYGLFDRGADIDWHTSPVPDKEWLWQFHRMNWWESYARAWWHTGDEKYVRAWCAELMDWRSRNPRDSGHAYAWRSIEAGIRGRRLAWCFLHFLHANAFTPAVLDAFLQTAHDHASYLMTIYRTGSNWALMEAEGLESIGIVFPEFSESAAWRKESFRRFGIEISRQVRPDGHQLEQSISYHAICIRLFHNPFELARMNGFEREFPPDYLSTIERMVTAVMKLGLPDGTFAQFGDAWAGPPGSVQSLLRTWTKVFPRDDLRYVATGGGKGCLPEATAWALSDSGFYSMRSGWDTDATCVVLKCGPGGWAHCHPDNGSFAFMAHGRNLMPDSGCYIYSGDRKARAWFRRTASHQTLTLDGANSAFAPSLKLWQPGSDMDAVVVENDSYPGLKHRRALLFVNDAYLVVIDDAIGTATGELRLHYQLAPGDARIDARKLAAQTLSTTSPNVLVRACAQPEPSMAEEEGWVSFEYTKKQPRAAFAYVVPKLSEKTVRFVTVIVPAAVGTSLPSVTCAIEGETEAGRAEAAVCVGDRLLRVGYDLATGEAWSR